MVEPNPSGQFNLLVESSTGETSVGGDSGDDSGLIAATMYLSPYGWHMDETWIDFGLGHYEYAGSSSSTCDVYATGETFAILPDGHVICETGSEDRSQKVYVSMQPESNTGSRMFTPN